MEELLGLFCIHIGLCLHVSLTVGELKFSLSDAYVRINVRAVLVFNQNHFFGTLAAIIPPTSPAPLLS